MKYIVVATLVALVTTSCGNRAEQAVTLSDATERTTTASAVSPEDVIVTLDDLPPGWSISPDTNSDSSKASCIDTALGDKPPYETTGPLVATAAFDQSTLGPFLHAGVAGDANAQAQLKELRDAYGACDGTVDADGNTQHVVPMTFPTIGDETFAVRLEFRGGFAVTALIAYARVDNTVLTVALIYFGEAADPALVETVLRVMVGRL